MYDVQTILSAYDKQGTLVQWLKNLDETLKGSGLESVNTIPVEGGYKLQFKFANGVVLESDLIQKINTLSIEADSVKLALTDANGVLVEYYSTLTLNGENVESNIKLLLPIKGSESVIVDVAENGTAIEIHLDADIINDINRALKTPLANPSATELVAVDTNGVQTMLEIGQGLKVEAGILEAEATGGSGGLTKTKVTLSELQALMTEENIGTIVGIASKNDVSFATLGLPEVFIITQNLDFGIGIYGDGSLVGAGTENNFVITSVSFSIRATNKKMELRAMNLGGNPLAIDLGTPQDMSETLLIDDYFDFYIYK